ncbi:MAG: hypothetical protein ACR2P4_08420 [Gammaproteobacteria bacterium]
MTALPINQALKGRPILLQGKARQKPQTRKPPAPSSFRRTPESPFAFYEIPASAGMTGYIPPPLSRE